jgi:hypothetical protein
VGNHTLRPILKILMPDHRPRLSGNSQGATHPGIAVGVYEIKAAPDKDLGKVVKPDPHSEEEKSKAEDPKADTAADRPV